MTKFWMCFVEGSRESRVRYEVEAVARTEAERLARTTGKPTYLLASVAVVQPKEAPLEWSEL